MKWVLIWIWVGLVVVASTAVKAEEAAEIVRWDRAPIPLTLPVGEERYIWFPGRVQPGIPPELTSKLRVQAVNDTIYLLASESFEATRLPVRDLEGGDFYLFDVRTDDEASSAPLRVVKTEGRDEGALTDATNAEVGATGSEDFGYVELTRFAAQQIYAPKRLVEQTPGISKVPLPATGQPTAAFYRGGEVTTTPVASWRGQSGLYVTAVKVTNATQNRLALDPRLARGDWLAATFHHRELGPNGEASDTSTLYLISDRPFLEVAEPWLG